MRVYGFTSITSLVALCLTGGAGALPFATAAAQGPAAVVGDAAEYRLTATVPVRPRPAEQIEAAARRFAPAVRHCYQEEGLKEDPGLVGNLRVELVVGPGGDVRTARVTVTGERGLGMRAVVSCVSSAARAWHFAPGPFREEHVGLSFRLHATD